MVSIDYKGLKFYEKAHTLTLEVYKLTGKFPKEEQFGLASQLKRASVSIGSNIAEGSGRSTFKDFRSFLYNALGSAKEVEYQLLVAKDLGFIENSTYEKLIWLLNEIIGSITNYIKKISEN